MNLSRPRLLALLSRCVGNEIWSVPTCRSYGVPEAWIEELADAFESGFEDDHETIYLGDATTNQYHGVRDVDLAIRIGRMLGVNIDQATEMAWGGPAVVRSITDAIMEGD